VAAVHEAIERARAFTAGPTPLADALADDFDRLLSADAPPTFCAAVANGSPRAPPCAASQVEPCTDAETPGAADSVLSTRGKAAARPVRPLPAPDPLRSTSGAAEERESDGEVLPQLPRDLQITAGALRRKEAARASRTLRRHLDADEDSSVGSLSPTRIQRLGESVRTSALHSAERRRQMRSSGEVLGELSNHLRAAVPQGELHAARALDSDAEMSDSAAEPPSRAPGDGADVPQKQEKLERLKQRAVASRLRAPEPPAKDAREAADSDSEDDTNWVLFRGRP